jgi:oligopeptide transport system substrate-binding protein
MNNVLRICSHKDPLTLDPQKSGESVSSAIIFLLFRGLTRFDEDHKIHCDLANSFHVLEEGKKYIFFLGEHYWSNGRPITAHDFVHSWKRALVPDFPVRATNFFSYLKNGEKAKQGKTSLNKVGVYAKDDLTLVVELQYPCSYFLELVSFCPLFPVSREANEAEIYSICSGPFQLERWEKGEEILLRRNPLYTKRNPIYLDGIQVKIVPDAKEAFTLFENDELDWIGDFLSPLPVSYLPALLEVKRIKPIAGFTSCWFNSLTSPFQNVNLRRAFGHTVPREQLIEKLMLPNGLLAKRFSPSILADADSPSIFSEDEDQAKASFEKALEELKVKRLSLTLTYEATDEFSRLATLLKANWERMFKVNIQLQPLSFKELWQILPNRHFDMSLFCHAAQYTDIINFLERFEFRNATRNFSQWENKEYQALLRRYRKTSKQEERQKLAAKAEAMLLSEMPSAPIYYYHATYLQKPHVSNLTVSPIGVMQFDRVFLEQQQQIAHQKSSLAHRN